MTLALVFAIISFSLVRGALVQTKEFFDRDTYTLTYVIFDKNSGDAVVIDPVWNFDPASGRLNDSSVNQICEFIAANNLKVHYILETHAHADHLSGAQLIKKRIPTAKLAIGERICEVQKVFKKIFNLGDSFRTDGSQFDCLLKDNEEFSAGSIIIKVMFTPGHTPACCSYLVGDSVFTGDALFMPDYGTGRCDFPKGSAENLYDSITGRIYALPTETKVYPGHDYQPGGRPLKFMSTVGEEKAENIQLKAQTTKEQFVKFRTERDKTLNAPKLLLQSVQINILAGHLPTAENNGVSYLKLPLTV